MSNLVSETIYKDLKERGLNLATPTILIIPQKNTKQPSFFKKLGGMLKTQQLEKNDIIAFPILSSAILVAYNNIIYVYRYTINDETSQLDVQHIQIISLNYNVKKIHQCPNKYIRDRSDLPILIQSSNGFGFFIFDLKEFKLLQKNYIKNNYILSVSMTTDKQAIMFDSQQNVRIYTLSYGKLKEKHCYNVKITRQKNQILKKTWIINEVDQQVQSMITFFYALTLPPSHQKMVLRVKQLWRTVDGQILHTLDKSNHYLQTDSLMYRDQFSIRSVGDYYCLQMATEILIMKKKFDKYMILDSLNERFYDHKIFINKNGIVASFGENVMQLNSIKFSDPKSTLRICDVIDLPQSLCGFQHNFIQAWPILNGKQYSLIFTFIKGNQIYLANIFKMEPLQKMIELAKVRNKQLQIVRDMALNLGISTKDFYLKLWSQSAKQNHDIDTYLIPCNDVPSIKKQLKSLLRRRTIPVSEMFKILNKITLITTQNLKESMSQINLRQHLKNHFLRRKLRLNQVNKPLDHRVFDKIYNSSIISMTVDFISEEIDPVQIIIDPLHAMVDQTPSKQLKSLQNVFQEFKVLLLQDYKDFLIQIFQRFPGKILQILNNFSFLLPNYPFDIKVRKPSKINQPVVKDLHDINNSSQQLWFQSVSVSQWANEISKQRILNNFSSHHPTSKIIEAVDQFIKSLYGRQNKRGKHGLISLDLEQYTQKVNQIQGIKLYLEVCQFANEQSFQSNDDPQISLKIIEILQKKNKLVSPDLEYCILYARMHYFMLKFNIIQKQKLKINQLTKFKPQSLVALFFLENKQQKQYIFRDFMQLYAQKTQFQDVLRSFVQSENCSKIQLQILMKEIIDMGLKFQRENQQIIEILLIGQCMKLQIRQNPAILQNQNNNQQINLIQNLQISKGLALKINKIKQLRKCQDLFKKFKCSKMTYEQVLALEEDNKIFKLLLDKYFNNELTENFIEIQQQIIDLESPRNMLTVLMYLQQTVFYNVRPFDIFIEYGLVLIQWKQFEVIKNLIDENQAFQAFEIERNQWIESLILRALDNIYLDLQIIYDQETKQQIINVVGIVPYDSPLKIQELAKLELVQIFQSWQCSVHCSDIYTICHEWSQFRRQQFIEDLIARYVNKLTFQTFEAVYTELEIIDRKTTQINIHNVEYVEFCVLYARKLLQKNRFKQVIEVFTFIKSLVNVPINYELQSEAFLKSISHIYEQDIQMGRKMIEFFLQNNKPELDYKVKQLFESYFDETSLSIWERQNKIKVNPVYFYKQAIGQYQSQCQYYLDDLWEIAQRGTKSTQQTYYNYYFLMVTMINPSVGLKKINGISYSLDSITDILLLHLDNFNRDQKQYWIINFDQFLERFLKGLAGLAIHRLEVGPEIQGMSKLDTILQLLKQDRQYNNELIKSLTRVRQQVKSKLKRTERKDRFLGFLNEIKINKQKQRAAMAALAAQNQQIQQPSETEIFLSWKKIQGEKKNISNRSHYFISEKQLIQQVYQSMSETIKHEPKKNTNKTSILGNLFLNNINNKTDNVGLIVDMLNKGEFERAGNFPPALVSEALHQIYSQNLNIDPYQMVDLMENLKIGDQKKIQIFKLTKYFRGSLTNQQLNTLFNFQFFTVPLEVEEDFKYAVIYEELQPRIKQIIENITPDGLKDLAHLLGNSLESTEYSALVYFETLLYLSENSVFASNSAIIAQQCVVGLGQYPQIIVNRYQNLLQGNYTDPELKLFLRQNLFRLMQDKGYEEVAKSIKAF